MDKKNNQVLEETLLKLKDKKLDISDYIGIVCLILYSKDFFASNNEIKKFLEEVFDIVYLEYVMKSRSLIVARTTRYILGLEVKEINRSKVNLIRYIENLRGLKHKKNKKLNENDKLNIWLKGL